ncbi:unnamed protein product [Rhizophagus irregularis]|nr:unnamed protein product [Rhizophagus irregularis]
MASIANNFSLKEFGDFLKLLDEKDFTDLLETMLQVLRSTSATGIYQTATNFEPDIYKCLEGLLQHILTSSKNWPYTPRGKKRVTYADVVLGSGSDSRPTSPSPEKKWNTQHTSKKGSTNKPQQQQTKKKSKLTLEKTISSVMTGYTPEIRLMFGR